LAATIGRRFPLSILGRASSQPIDAVRDALRQLESAGLVVRQSDDEYRFRHALIRDAAYQSQPRAGRQAAHLRVAAALHEHGGRFATIHPEVLAGHFAAGGDIRQAIGYWLTAGNLASRQGANREAIDHYRAGLALIERLPAGAERDRCEFDLQNGLGLALGAVEGYAAAAADLAHARALALCERLPGNQDIFRAVWGLWASASSRGGFPYASELAGRLQAMAEGSGDPIRRQQAEFALGNTCFWQGRFLEARRHLDAVLADYRPRQHADHVALCGEDVGVTAGAYLSWVLDALGLQAEAGVAEARALRRARQLRHPFSLAYALTFSALRACRRGDAETALAQADEILALAEAHGYELWRLGGRVASGWARALRGDPAGSEEVAACLSGLEAAMSGASLVVLGPLASAHARLGQHAAALAAIDEALRVGKRLGDHHLDGPLYCLQGEMLLSMAADDALSVGRAAEAYRKALAIGQSQQALPVVRKAEQALAQLGRRPDESSPTVRPG
jgi:predicted ATPase